MKNKKIVEKKTKEKYASKAAMMKHEKSESKAEMKKEYGKPKPPTRQMTKVANEQARGPVTKKSVEKNPPSDVGKKPSAPIRMNSAAYMKVSAKKAPAKMKNC